jgi:Integrator complex subunit 5 C-terminus
VPNEEAYGQLLPSKLAFPRDQEVSKLFAEHPVLWQLLELVASEGGSVLCHHLDNVRSLLATLICYWHARSGAALERFRAHTGSGSGNSNGASGDNDSGKQAQRSLLQTCRLLELLRGAHWLPAPLCHVSHVVASLQNASEVTAVLLDVWNFLRDFPPTPDQFVQPPSGEVSARLWPHGFSVRPYTLTLMKMLRKHVISLGSHFGRFFVQNNNGSTATASAGLLPPPDAASGGLLPTPPPLGTGGLLPTPSLDESDAGEPLLMGES